MSYDGTSNNGSHRPTYSPDTAYLKENFIQPSTFIHQFDLRPYHCYWILHVKQKYSFDTQRKKMKLDVEASVGIKGCDKHHIRVTKKGQRRHYPVCIFHNTSVAGVGFCRRFSLHQIVVLPPFPASLRQTFSTRNTWK